MSLWYYPNNIYVIYLILVFLLLTLNIFHTFFSVSIVYFEQINISWITIGVGL